MNQTRQTINTQHRIEERVRFATYPDIGFVYHCLVLLALSKPIDRLSVRQHHIDCWLMDQYVYRYTQYEDLNNPFPPRKRNK